MCNLKVKKSIIWSKNSPKRVGNGHLQFFCFLCTRAKKKKKKKEEEEKKALLSLTLPLDYYMKLSLKLAKKIIYRSTTVRPESNLGSSAV